MELDDLRRQWQQQPGGPSQPDLTTLKLQAMLANQPDTPVSELLRNAQRDQRLIFLMVILNVGNFTMLSRRFTHGGPLTLLYVALALMIVVISWFAYRQRQLIRRLQLADGTTAGYLRATLAQLRSFIHTKLYIKLAFLTMITFILGYGSYDSLRHSLQTGLNPLLVVLGVGVFLGIMAAALYAGQRRQQLRYGRHLDQLEGALRELEEKP
jgi:hypothetical protein